MQEETTTDYKLTFMQLVELDKDCNKYISESYEFDHN